MYARFSELMKLQEGDDVPAVRYGLTIWMGVGDYAKNQDSSRQFNGFCDIILH